MVFATGDLLQGQDMAGDAIIRLTWSYRRLADATRHRLRDLGFAKRFIKSFESGFLIS
jgi:hypothetical protein